MTETEDTTESARGDVDRRRRDVLDAAAEVLDEAAWNGFSMREVARRAGVSAGAVYQWFSGKDEIFSVLHAVRFDEERARLESLPDDLSFEVVVEDVLRSMALIWAEIGHHRTAFLQERDAEGHAVFLDNLADSFRSLTATIDRRFRGAAAREGLELREPAEMIPWFWAVCIGTGTQLIYEKFVGTLTGDDLVAAAAGPTAAGLIKPPA